MTERLYYTDPNPTEFEAELIDFRVEPKPALVLEKTAFYPTSGGQLFDTGYLEAIGEISPTDNVRLRVYEVVEQDDTVLHYFLPETGGVLISNPFGAYCEL